ncbi:MAG: DUF1353 domain-containing protein [Verrucomicrobiota bacterium]
MSYKKRRRYKYNLHSDNVYETGITVDKPGDLGLVNITSTGKLYIKKGYAWDGPSGPTIDTKNFMQGSLVHDALYQLIREGVLTLDDRLRADEILREICLEDGMSKIRAWYVYKSVRAFGESSATPDLLHAPDDEPR